MLWGVRARLQTGRVQESVGCESTVRTESRRAPGKASGVKSGDRAVRVKSAGK
ncbi:hypothetical protein [Paenibacillus amylolyticus]|uniref:hypothetical protein n=1 Tax=Paenibacillus amylolyticus TaxID=1451 RepID=UPI003EB8C2A1